VGLAPTATGTISILDGSTFVASNARGDIDADPSQPHGLFHRDTRFLSRWRLTVNGATPDALSRSRTSSTTHRTCELQGYVYDAKRRAARLAREIWGDEELAQRLEREAAALQEQFNRDFWLEDRQYFALALDGDKRPVDSLTSNIGHLLWERDRRRREGPALVAHLLEERLFSGWGVRTMAAGEGPAGSAHAPPPV
jgi:glycogen debranching enzyme